MCTAPGYWAISSIPAYARELFELVDNLQLRATAALDPLGNHGEIRIGAVLQGEDARPPEDCVERRSQIVRHAGKAVFASGNGGTGFAVVN